MTKQERNEAGDGEPGIWRRAQRHYWLVIFAILLLSLLIHVLSVVELGQHQAHKSHLPAVKQAPVKFRVTQQPKRPAAKKTQVEKPTEPDSLPKILEAPQTKTERPDRADYAGTVNHKTTKETRLSNKLKREKAADAGQKGKPDVAEARQAGPEAPSRPEAKPQPPQKLKQSESQFKSRMGNLAVDAFQPKPRNLYEALLPTGAADLPGQLTAGYQDFIDEKVTEGDRIDINTSEYRYIGYFTSMRKAIELVWNYPLDAARKGEQGEVGLEFIIGKDGHVTQVRVLRSSGYLILDQAIMEAIKLASPFSPLPDGFGKTRLVVTGSFRYILNGL